MAQLVVRNLDEGVKQRLKARANLHGRTMEAEARAILTGAVASPPGADVRPLSLEIAALFADVGLRPGETLDRLPAGTLASPFDDDHR